MLASGRIGSGNVLASMEDNEIGQMRSIERAPRGGVACAIFLQQRTIAIFNFDRAMVWQQLLHPSEPPLAAEAPLVRIDMTYPARQLLVGESEWNWIVAAVVLIMLFGLVLGRIAGVRLG